MKCDFALLQSTGCLFKQCCSCDCHVDVSMDPYVVDLPVSVQMTVEYKVIGAIDSGSGIELLSRTLSKMKTVAKRRIIPSLGLEMRYIYRKCFPISLYCTAVLLSDSAQVWCHQKSSTVKS